MSATLTYTVTVALISDPAGTNTLSETQLKAMLKKAIEELNIGQGGTTIRVTSVVLL